MVARRFLPALLAVGASAASSATPSACSSATVTISAATDATALASCDTLQNVEVESTVTGVIQLEGPKKISGDLTVKDNGGLTTLSSGSIQSIGGTFTLNNLTTLSTLSFTNLSTVNEIEWNALPILTALTMGTPGITSAKKVIISDTQLPSLDGIDLEMVGHMDINNNGQLNDITLNLATVSELLSFSANGNSLKVDLPLLTWAVSMTITNVTTFSSPSLAWVNESMDFRFNYFTNYSAPNLTGTTTGDINFLNNAFLTNLSLPKLSKVGGAVTIVNNTNLYEVDQFDSLSTINGTCQLRGNFTKVEFPALSDVEGGFTVYSTSDISSDCKTLDGLKTAGKIKGSPYNCISNDTTANSGGNNGTASGGSSGGSGTSDKGSAASGLTINSAVVLVAALAGVMAHLL